MTRCFGYSLRNGKAETNRHVLGAHLLTGLHLKTKGPFEEVPVDLDASLEKEQGIVGRSFLLKRARSAKSLIFKSTGLVSYYVLAAIAL